MSVGFRTAISRRASLAALLAGVLAPALVATALTPAAADDFLVPSAQITLPNKITSFDIGFVDPQLGIYVLGDRTGNAVDVIDTTTNTLIVQAGKGLFVGVSPGGNDFSGPDGVMIVNHREIWAGDGDSTIKFLSLSTGALLGSVSTGGRKRVDEMCFDPVHQIGLVANNADAPPFATLVGARSKAVLAQICFDGTNGTPNAANGIEQCQFNPRTGTFFITIPAIGGPGDNSVPGGVSQISPTSLSVINTISVPIASCSGPQGLAIGPNDQMLLGCNGGPKMPPTRPTAIIADGSGGNPFGTVLFTVQQAAGADMVDFNPATNHYTLAASNYNPAATAGNPQLVPAACPGILGFKPGFAGPQLIVTIDALAGNKDADVVSGIFNCPAPNNHGGNHSIASDPVTNQTYFPVASTSGSTLCSSLGGTDTQGCIVVLVDPSSPQCVAQGAPVVDATAGRSPVLMMAPCP